MEQAENPTNTTMIDKSGPLKRTWLISEKESIKVRLEQIDKELAELDAADKAKEPEEIK